jgi:hypothetical protein
LSDDAQTRRSHPAHYPRHAAARSRAASVRGPDLGSDAGSTIPEARTHSRKPEGDRNYTRDPLRSGAQRISDSSVNGAALTTALADTLRMLAPVDALDTSRHCNTVAWDQTICAASATTEREKRASKTSLDGRA